MEDFNPLQIRTLKRIIGDYNKNGCSFGVGTGSSAWGSISGNIADQTDLSAALGAIDDDISTINTTLGTLGTSVDAKIPLTGTSAMSGSFLPATTNVSDFGDNTFRFRGGYFQNVYASGKMFVGALTNSAYTGLTVDMGLTSFLGSTLTVNGAILPNVGSLDIGAITSASTHWGTVYANSVRNQYSNFAVSIGGAVRGIFGTSSLPALDLTHTSQEQLRLSYDASNYLSATVNSTGTTTFTGTGTNVGYRFNNTGTGSFVVNGGNGLAVNDITTFGPTNMTLTVYGTNYLRGIINGFEAFRFHPSGNLSIKNTTDSNFPLDVTGTARVSGVLTLGSATIDPSAGFFNFSNSITTAGRIGVATGATFGATTPPSHTITLPSTATGIALHNQADQTTNWEAGRLYWNANTFTIGTEKGGIGAGRDLRLTVETNRNFRILGLGASLVGIFNFSSITSLSGNAIIGVTGTLSASTGAQYFSTVLGTVNQSSTAGYTANYTSIYEQALGTGPKILMDLGVNSAANGGGTHTSKARIDNTGKTTIADDFVNETVGKGWVTRSPDGTFYRVTVDNGGTTLIITAI